MRHTLPALALTALALLGSGATASAKQPTAKPNILLILADDLGFSDIGCYGGEVRTPNLDALASNGLRYTQFYNTTRCWPSRAAILTGYYAQQVRRDRSPGCAGPPATIRPSWAHLLPEYLAPAGYRSYHAGKWHVDGNPLKQGFDRSYYLHDTTNYFNPRSQFIDGVKERDVPIGFYATRAIADHAIEHLRDHSQSYSNRPFFEYLAFTAPHFPLQAEAADIAKYRGRFDAGWDILRSQRLKRLKEKGILSCDLSTRTPGVPAWNTLSLDARQKWAQRMEIHAAMVDRMDQEIGRVLAQVKSMGALDNTLVLFMSDNGASAEQCSPKYYTATAEIGSANSFVCLEAGWANLANTPLRLSKIYVHEGGISTPLIAQWPAGIRSRGELRRNPGHLVDLMPTILELAGVHKPSSGPAGLYIPPSPGRSLAPTFVRDNSVDHDYLWWYHGGNRAIRIGDWKIVAEGPGSPWELYNMVSDRSEMHDMAALNSAKVNDMAAIWKAHADEFKMAADSEAPPVYERIAVARKRRLPRIPRRRYSMNF